MIVSEYYAGELKTVYDLDSGGKIARVKPAKGSARRDNVRKLLRDVFLPNGFPHSVSEDYVPYQVWDTVQAFSSSITGALAIQAVLNGVGVGRAGASVVSATVDWLYRSGVGMIGQILFTWLCGTRLDYDCKMWRLVADVLNDVAILFDMLAPHFQLLFFLLFCTANLLRAIVGVAGHATRAAVVQHQSLSNNLADVAAKDGSQETLVNLVALVFNLMLIPLLSSKSFLIWTTFFLFTVLHLFANYRAVCTLKFSSLNRKRLSILAEHYLCSNEVLTVDEVNRLECHLLKLFAGSGRVTINYGLPMNDSRLKMKSAPSTTSAYLVSLCYIGSTLSQISLVLSVDATPKDMLMAAFHAHLLIHRYEARLLTIYLKHVQRSSELPLLLRQICSLGDVPKWLLGRPVALLGDIQSKCLHPFQECVHFFVQKRMYTPEKLQSDIDGRTEVETLFSDFCEKLKSMGWSTDYCMLGFSPWRVRISSGKL